ncbi:hypothetical protein JCM24511_09635 [Saitozyma sp. JCM 24511]|nr:hypothetical protein JCM24511_09635 [Saitozyma sp. JCM 24511]
MTKAKTDHGLARAILSAPYPLPVIHRTNRDPPTRLLITPAPPPPRPPPLPLSFNPTFPEMDKDWRKRGPAFPEVPYPEGSNEGKRKKKKKKTRVHEKDDGVVPDQQGVQDQDHHGMDDGVVRDQQGDQHQEHHGMDEGVVRDQQVDQDQDPHGMDDGVVQVKQMNHDHDIPDHHEGFEEVVNSEWGAEEVGKVMDVARQISDWIHESRARKGDRDRDRDSAAKPHDILNTVQKMTVPRSLSQHNTTPDPSDAEGSPPVHDHSQRSRSDRLRTPRAGSVEVKRERGELPTPPSTHPERNKEKYRATPVPDPSSPPPRPRHCYTPRRTPRTAHPSSDIRTPIHWGKISRSSHHAALEDVVDSGYESQETEQGTVHRLSFSRDRWAPHQTPMSFAERRAMLAERQQSRASVNEGPKDRGERGRGRSGPPSRSRSQSQSLRSRSGSSTPGPRGRALSTVEEDSDGSATPTQRTMDIASSAKPEPRNQHHKYRASVDPSSRRSYDLGPSHTQQVEATQTQPRPYTSYVQPPPPAPRASSAPPAHSVPSASTRHLDPATVAAAAPLPAPAPAPAPAPGQASNTPQVLYNPSVQLPTGFANPALGFVQIGNSSGPSDFERSQFAPTPAPAPAPAADQTSNTCRLPYNPPTQLPTAFTNPAPGFGPISGSSAVPDFGRPQTLQAPDPAAPPALTPRAWSPEPMSIDPQSGQSATASWPTPPSAQESLMDVDTPTPTRNRFPHPLQPQQPQQPQPPYEANSKGWNFGPLYPPQNQYYPGSSMAAENGNGPSTRPYTQFEGYWVGQPQLQPQLQAQPQFQAAPPQTFGPPFANGANPAMYQYPAGSSMGYGTQIQPQFQAQVFPQAPQYINPNYVQANGAPSSYLYNPSATFVSSAQPPQQTQPSQPAPAPGSWPPQGPQYTPFNPAQPNTNQTPYYQFPPGPYAPFAQHAQFAPVAQTQYAPAPPAPPASAAPFAGPSQAPVNAGPNPPTNPGLESSLPHLPYSYGRRLASRLANGDYSGFGRDMDLQNSGVNRMAMDVLREALDELKRLETDKKTYNELLGVWNEKMEEKERNEKMEEKERNEKVEEKERRPPRKRKRSMSPDSAEEHRTKTRVSSGPVPPDSFPDGTALGSPVDLRPTEPWAEQSTRNGHDQMQGAGDMLGDFEAMLAAAGVTTEEEELEEMKWRREAWLASEAGGM